MSKQAVARPTDQTAVALSALAILGISLFVQEAIASQQALTFIIGIGLGITLFHAAFGFTGGWRKFIRDRDSAGVRAQLLLLGITSLLFFPILGQVFDVAAAPALAPVGVSVLVGAFLFGIGMQLGGGCGSGTLFTMGQGQVDMLITLIFFIVGATLGSAHLHWWLELPNVGAVSLVQSLGWWQGLILQGLVLAALYLLVRYLDRRRRNSAPEPLQWGVPREEVSQRLIHGPWPLWWGVLGLAVLNLATLFTAGHPWTITFAFGLWGAKIWGALGGDPASWPYWSSGYPNQALNDSVLADTTSVMDFGLILGALLAAALAGKYAPAMKLKGKRILTAVIGGLLLGYGARLAFGCNIGALLAGISSGSLHGWLWLVSGFAGGIVGVYLRIWLGLDKPIAQGK